MSQATDTRVCTHWESHSFLVHGYQNFYFLHSIPLVKIGSLCRFKVCGDEHVPNARTHPHVPNTQRHGVLDLRKLTSRPFVCFLSVHGKLRFQTIQIQLIKAFFILDVLDNLLVLSHCCRVLVVGTVPVELMTSCERERTEVQLLPASEMYNISHKFLKLSYSLGVCVCVCLEIPVQKEWGSSLCISPHFALNNILPHRAHSSFSRSPGFILFFTFRKISQYFPKKDFSKDPLSGDLLWKGCVKMET